MKIQCPDCKSVYKLDVSKLPEIPATGAFVTCKKCKGRVPVIPLEEKREPPKKEAQRDIIIPCPKCGHLNISSDTCAGCGTTFSADEKEKLKIPLSED